MKTLQQLIRELNAQATTQDIENVREVWASFTAYSGTDWRQCLEERENIILLQNEHFRLLLIYWPPYKRSSKHGHPPGGGLIRMLSGSLLETRFAPLAPERIIGKYRYRADAISYIHDSVALHVVENPSNKPAVSLHLYGMGSNEAKHLETKAA